MGEKKVKKIQTKERCSWIGRINTAKMLTVFKTIFRSTAILTNIPKAFFTKIKVLKFVWNHKRHGRIKVTLRKQDKAGSIMLPDLNYIIKLQQSKQYDNDLKTDTKMNGKI